MRGLAFSNSQIETLKTVAGLLPTHELRERFTGILAERLQGKDAIGEGELSRLARGICNELLARQEQQQLPRRADVLDGIGAVP